MSAVAEAAKAAAKYDGPVTLNELGVSRTTLQKAIDERVLGHVEQTRETGQRGRPARQFKLLAKGRKLANGAA